MLAHHQLAAASHRDTSLENVPFPNLNGCTMWAALWAVLQKYLYTCSTGTNTKHTTTTVSISPWLFICCSYCLLGGWNLSGKIKLELVTTFWHRRKRKAARAWGSDRFLLLASCDVISTTVMWPVSLRVTPWVLLVLHGPVLMTRLN